MQYYYGDKNILRALDETEFWKRQETEHAQLIRAVSPGLEQPFTDALYAYEADAAAANARTARFIESAARGGPQPNARLCEEAKAWALECAAQSTRFAEALSRMLRESAALKKNDAAREVVNHIIREAQYYAGIAQLIAM